MQLHQSLRQKIMKKSQNSRNERFSYFFVLFMEGSESGRPKNSMIGNHYIAYVGMVHPYLEKHLCGKPTSWNPPLVKYPGTCISSPAARLARSSAPSKLRYFTVSDKASSVAAERRRWKRTVCVKVRAPGWEGWDAAALLLTRVRTVRRSPARSVSAALNNEEWRWLGSMLSDNEQEAMNFG